MARPTPRAASRRSPSFPARSRPWPRNWTFPWWRCPSSPAPPSSAGASIGGPSSRTCGSPGRSSRTPTSCASSIARSSTTVPSTPRRTRPSRAWRSSSWASSATARRGPLSCSSRRNTRVSTTTPRANRRPRPPVGKAGSVFRCTDCGAEQPKWGGRCEACGAWNTLVEEPVGRTGGRADRNAVPSGTPPVRLSAVGAAGFERWQTGLREFDFVLGGGIVPGSVVLVGGEPGIGKSTLLLQCAARLEQAGVPTLYVSGEEAPDQIRLRAERLTVDAGAGLEPVADPAAAFRAGRSTGVSGSAVTALMEGTRPLLVEIQALAAKTGFGTPQRVATGLDHRRLAVLLAVLERRGGLPFGERDVFVNVTGGVRLIEPSTDLAVVAALVSSVHDRPLPADAVFLGEVGLGGEIRPVGAVERRLGEAARQGFRRVFLSARSRVSLPGLDLVGMDGIGDLARRLAA